MSAIERLRARVAGLADSMLATTAGQLEAEQPMNQEQRILYSVVAVELSKRHHRDPQAIAARVKTGEPLLDAVTRP